MYLCCGVRVRVPLRQCECVSQMGTQIHDMEIVTKRTHNFPTGSPNQRWFDHCMRSIPWTHTHISAHNKHAHHLHVCVEYHLLPDWIDNMKIIDARVEKRETEGNPIDWWKFSQHFIHMHARTQRHIHTQKQAVSLSLKQQPHILNWNVNGTMAPIIPTLYKQVSSVFARVVCKILLFSTKTISIPQYGHQVNSAFRVYWNRPISS